MVPIILTFNTISSFTNGTLLGFAIFFIHRKRRGHPGPTSQLNVFVVNGSVAAALSSVSCVLFTLCDISLPTALNTYTYASSKENRVGNVVWIYFSDFFEYCMFDLAHSNFAVLLSLNLLLYCAFPLHYHTVLSAKRCIAICSVSWLLAVLEAFRYVLLSSIPMNAQTFSKILVTVQFLYEFLPVLIAYFCALAIVILLYRAACTRRKCKGVKEKLQLFFSMSKSILKVFRVSMLLMLFFSPFVVYLSISSFLLAEMVDMAQYEAAAMHILCQKPAIAIFYVSVIMAHLYIAAMPLFIVLTHPIYWKHMKIVLCRCKMATAANRTSGNHDEKTNDVE